jgi:hypothetical protein
MRAAFVLAAFLVLPSSLVFAQNGPPACDGTLAVVRVSEIKPGGSMSGFLAAVAAHKAWYRANGVTDNDILVSRVIVRDQTTGVQSYSEKEALTYHVNPPARARTPNRGDAAWNDYVKLYRDNSDIKSEYMTCMPKFSRP